jgi:hypothetical protein
MHTKYEAYVASDLYQAGVACDGHPFIAEQYYVLIENKAGRRFRHVRTFNGANAYVCEYTGETGFEDLRETAIRRAQSLADRVNAAFDVDVGVDWTYWYEVDPVYGSDEYIAQGTEAQRAMAERMEG